MRRLAILATSLILIAISDSATAGPLPLAPLARNVEPAVVLVQDKPKRDDTLTQKAKRVWRNLTGYKSAVTCPALPIPIVTNRTTCTETGKNPEEARAKCQSRHPLCAVAAAK